MKKYSVLFIIACVYIINLLLAYIQKFFIWPSLAQFVPLFKYGRVTGFFALPSSFTVFHISTGYFLFFSVLRIHRKFVRYGLLTLFLPLSVLPIIWTRSFMLLPIFITFLVYCVLYHHPFHLKKHLIIGLTALVFVLTFYLLLTRNFSLQNFQFRLENWDVAVRMGLTHMPWGSGSFHYWFQYRKFVHPPANETRLAHSVPLQILSEWGIFPFLLFLLFTALFFRYLHILARSSPENHILLQPLSFIVVHQFFDVGIFDRQGFPIVLTTFILFLWALSPLPTRIPLYITMGVVFFTFLLSIRVFNIYTGIPRPDALTTRTRVHLPVRTIDELFRTYYKQKPCSDGIVWQPWDARLFQYCANLALKQESFMTSGFFLYRAFENAPRSEEFIQLWQSWLKTWKKLNERGQ